MAQFVLNVQDIDASGKDYEFPVPTMWVERVLEGTDLKAAAGAPDGAFDLRVQRSGEDIIVTGRVRSCIVAPCVRCLEDAKVDVDVEIAGLFSVRGNRHRPQPDEADLTPEEIAREFYSGEEIVLDEVVREQMILDVPMQPLCSESCPGIPIPEHVRPPEDFGAEEDPDPRFAPLKALANRIQQKKE